MKNLIFINPTMGVGKTSTPTQLKKLLPKCVFLDGDFCWDMSPFIVNEETKNMVINNITHLLNNFINCSEFENIIFCWVMNDECIISDILNKLKGEYNLYKFFLICNETTHTMPIDKDIESEIRPYNSVEIDVSCISDFDAAKIIFNKLSCVIETHRLILRQMTKEDFPSLCKILQDKDVMYAYEHAFSDEESQQWLDKQINRYKDYGFGLWAVTLKETGEMIGQCGLTMQDIGNEDVLEVGYLFMKSFWHNGYATEAAIACKSYAFDKLNADKVYSIIRDNNIPSQNVATRNGMKICGQLVKHYYNMDMPHLIYLAKRGKNDN